MIEKLFNKETIELNVEVNDWIDAIRFCGSLFVKNGNTEAKYTDAMINTVKNMGQYIVIEKGIAMPHARPEDGAKKIGMGLIKLKKPIEFGNEEYDPVDILIFICAIDKTSHLKEDVLSYINSKSF
jgi:PTS system ascorbate-specific IIA component